MGMDVDDDAMMMMMMILLLFIIMDIETEEEQSTARKRAYIVSYDFLCKPVYHIKRQICSWSLVVIRN